MIRYLKNDIMGPLRQVAKALGYPPLVGLWPAISFKIFKFKKGKSSIHAYCKIERCFDIVSML